MSLSVLVVNIILAITLFFLNGFIGKLKQGFGYAFNYSTFGFQNISEENFAGNFFHAIIHPAIYLAVLSSIFQIFSLHTIPGDLWLVVPLYWLFRFLHTILMNRLSLINWQFEIPALIASLVLGEGTLFLVICPLINSDETVFINLEQFRDAFWFAVFTYVAKSFWDIFKEKTTGETIYPAEKKARIIIKRYRYFNRKYNKHIELTLDNGYRFSSPSNKKHFCCLLYAIMIYEDHNRPFLIRIAEYLLKFIFHRHTFSLGIMQVQSTNLIGNKMSITLAINKLHTVFSTSNDNEKIFDTLHAYNPSNFYCREVISIYDVLKEELGLYKIGKHRAKVRKLGKASSDCT